MKHAILYKYLFFAIVVFYCLVLSQFGMENYDTGYIPSFSWRIINGQAVYEDFIYKGPPVTLYLHALFMKLLPVSGQFFFFRIIAYLFFAFQVYFCVTAFDNCYKFDTFKVNRWAVMSACFIISLLNFSPYPWPTTDGLLFVSIAFWLMSTKREATFFKLFSIAFFCVLCALTKQSFYLIPFVFLAWIYVKYGFKKAVYFLLQLLFLAIAFYLILSSFSSFKKFIDQTTGETTLFQLYQTGLSNYLLISKWILLVAIALLATAVIYIRKTRPHINIPVQLNKILFGVLLLFAILCVPYRLEMASRIAFDACLLGILYLFFFVKKSIQYLMPMLVGLSISWSVSISLGHPFPILFATGIILSLLIILKDMGIITTKTSISPVFSIGLALTTLVGFSYHLTPYREQNIFTLTYPLDGISPKLKYIKTNKENYEKHLELKNLIQKYGDHFIVAPSFSIANYIFDNQSELPADWIIDTEINREFSHFIALASQKENFVFLEKSFVEGSVFKVSGRADSSYLGEYIFDHFNKIAETEYFIIYNGSNK